MMKYEQNLSKNTGKGIQKKVQKMWANHRHRPKKINTGKNTRLTSILLRLLKCPQQ